MTQLDARARPTAPAPSDERRLWKAFARGVLFNLQAEMVANLIRVGGVIFLARALEPRDFGLLRILSAGSDCRTDRYCRIPRGANPTQGAVDRASNNRLVADRGVRGDSRRIAVCGRAVDRAVHDDGQFGRDDSPNMYPAFYREHRRRTQCPFTTRAALRRLGRRRYNRGGRLCHLRLHAALPGV